MGLISIFYAVVMSESSEVEIPAFLENPWFLAVFGWVLYNVGNLLVNQKKYDVNHDGIGWYELLAYLRFSWVGMLFSLMLLPIMIPYTHDIWHYTWDFFGKDYEFSKLAYAGVGIVMVGLQYMVLWIKERFSKK